MSFEPEPEPPAVPIRVSNAGAVDANGYPVRCGVPLTSGACHDVAALTLVENGCVRPCQLTSLTRWPDGSLRWVLVESMVDVPANDTITLVLGRAASPGDDAPAHDEVDSVAASAERLESVVTGYRSVSARKRTDSPVPHLSLDGHDLHPFADMLIEASDADGERYAFRSDDAELVEERGTTRSSFASGGCFVDRHGKVAMRVAGRIDVHGAPSSASLHLTVHNPRAATHAGGYWDLGDPASCRFDDLSIVIRKRGGKVSGLRLRADGAWHDTVLDDISLTQLTSGAALHASPNHVNAEGRVPRPEEGFRLRVGARTVERGDRCSPRVRLDAGIGAGIGAGIDAGANAEATCTLGLENFWQNFPKAIDVDDECVRIGLFPSAYPDVFELQGGEKKTHVLHVGFGARDPGWFDGDVVCGVDASAWSAARALPWFDGNTSDAALDSLIDQGLSGPDDFFVKRERIDEYGWRHFGDVHADHETWGRDSQAPLSSHYNNQYDLLYGFIRMFARTGAPGWQRLARDLAAHVLDIDLYDTRADRPQYNGGLFWHTDHYREASTCTHRTYSASHAREDEGATGGGPGGEHCYTTGLKLHHLTTGCERARAAVFDLAEWVGRFYDGDGTLLEALYRTLRDRGAGLRSVARGEPVFRHRYPIHRGIGNLVVAQLDAFELSGSREYLERAERVVTGTVGPRDDLAARGLDDVEEGWFYTIFLQALIRYLDVKRTLGELDAAFFYARDSLLHYADWIMERERPYLDDPDALEFPNHTWAAQDARRCAILLEAWRYSRTARPELLERARFFATYVTSALGAEPTRTYTRILAISMQNHGASALALASPERHRLPAPEPYVAQLHRRHTLGSLLAGHARALAGTLAGTSPRAELRWLRTRMRR